MTLKHDNKYDVVLISGAFDPLHVGHIKLIQDAKLYAREIVIALNSDEWLAHEKGKSFMPFDERKLIMENVKDVQWVFGFDDADGTACNAIETMVKLYGNVNNKILFANGGNRNKTNVPEQDLCKKLGVELIWKIGGNTQIITEIDRIRNKIPQYYPSEGNVEIFEEE